MKAKSIFSVRLEAKFEGLYQKLKQATLLSKLNPLIS